jgi:hypothetical protein
MDAIEYFLMPGPSSADFSGQKSRVSRRYALRGVSLAI